jgi:antitoxin component of MazEF toxin-antitoxin module
MTKVYIGKNGQVHVTIPKAIAKAKGFKHMQEVEWKIDNIGQLILMVKT